MEEVLRTALSYTMEAAAPILAALLAALVIKLLRWAGVKMDAANEAKWDALAAKAMEYADQWVRSKAKLGEAKPAQHQIMQEALNYAMGVAGDKLPLEFSKRIDAQLGAVNRYKDGM